MSVFMHVFVHHEDAWCPKRSAEDRKRTSALLQLASDGWELPCVYRELNLEPAQEQVLSITKPFLQPLLSLFKTGSQSLAK